MGYKSREQQSEYSRVWIAKRREDWLKKNGPCATPNCLTPWDNLEIDHIDKNKKVSHKVFSWSQARRDEEMKKCQVLCHDCHLKKSAALAEGPYKITTEQVAELRRVRHTTGISLDELGKMFGISRSQAGRIMKGIHRTKA